MKKSLLFLGLVSVVCFAEGGPDINQIKSQILKMNGERIAILNSESSCIQNANSIEDIKTCKLTTRTLMESKKTEMKAKKEEMFKNRRDKESNSHQSRIDILNKADNCIKNATTKEAYQECERVERAERQSLKGQF